jgi:hypothetical protein
MNNTQQTLCKGYSLVWSDETSDTRRERLFAVTDSGKVYISGVQPYSHKFDAPKWKETKLVLEDVEFIEAEYIGNYRISIQA